MSKHKRRRHRPLTKIQDRIEQLSPTQVITDPVSEQTRIRALGYGPDSIEEIEISKPDDLKERIGKWPVLWVHVDGLADVEAIKRLGELFHLHELAVEDVLNVRQRAKLETYGKHLFMVLRSMAVSHETLVSEQVSLFLGHGFVLTFEETSTHDGLSPVRERICRSTGHMRNEQADYLLYAIVDTIIDGYFPVLETLGDALEALEDEIVDHTDKYTPARIHELKRDVLSVRRAIWPARDAVNALAREDETDLLTAKTLLYLRDCYDHAMRIMDLVETQREMCADLMDLYMSSVSNHMNEIVKILTIVTLVFMPPTLVAGIYGMNFKIPEYGWHYGYAYALATMVLTGGGVYLWARRKGWLDDDGIKG